MIVFFVPITLRMTSMFGSDSEGPAKSKAKAGPFPMPEDNNPCTIGTSVSVAKYINAPVKLAKKLDNNEFPPTDHSIQLFGMMPAMEVLSCVDPNKKPAVTTPMANNGNICLAKPQAENTHSLFSSFCLSKSSITDNTVIAVIIGISGTDFAEVINMFARMAETNVATAPVTTHHVRNFSMLTRDQHSSNASAPVMYHLYVKIQLHSPVPDAVGAPQLAKTRIKTKVKK